MQHAMAIEAHKNQVVQLCGFHLMKLMQLPDMVAFDEIFADFTKAEYLVSQAKRKVASNKCNNTKGFFIIIYRDIYPTNQPNLRRSVVLVKQVDHGNGFLGAKRRIFHLLRYFVISD
jgi:hypothetical protein